MNAACVHMYSIAKDALWTALYARLVTETIDKRTYVLGINTVKLIRMYIHTYIHMYVRTRPSMYIHMYVRTRPSMYIICTRRNWKIQ